MDLNQLTIIEASNLLDKRKISSVELTKACLKRIRKVDPKIKAFIEVTEDLALKQAVASDKRSAFAKASADRHATRGRSRLLDGIPYALKDVFANYETLTTAASKILENYQAPAPYEATTVKKLREAGAVLIGRTNTDEFTMGSSTETSYFGPTRNPWDLERVPGGSSGGSAAAIASGMSLFAIGTDTGGSIRQPASLCGIVGLKPTYGRVSRFGEFAMASSLDQTGPLTKTAEDAAIALQIIAGRDPLDATSLSDPVPNYWSNLSNKSNLTNLTIGLPQEFYGRGINRETENLIKKAVKNLEKLGAKIKKVSLPNIQYSLAAYYIIAPAEVSSNLARYDGIKYGFSIERSDKRQATSDKEKSNSLYDVYAKSRAIGFGSEVKRRIMIGTYVLSSGYYDAYYRKAQNVRVLIADDFDRVFKKVDALITPTSPAPAFKIGEKASDPLAMYKADICTVPVNLAGLPAISIPCGFENDLPVGMQIIGPRLRENVILQIGKAYQETTEWHKMRPSLNQKSKINLPAGRQECKMTDKNAKRIFFLNFSLSF